MQVPPAMSVTTESSASLSRPTAQTLAPWAAKARAACAPTPRDPPVMKTTLLFRPG
jgi:hypothetical protein